MSSLTDYRRHLKVSNNLAEALKADLYRTSEGSEQDPPFAGVIDDTIKHLNVREREIIELSAWEQLTPTEIAIDIGMKPGAVRVQLHRVRQLIGDTLIESGYVPPARLRTA